MTTTRHPTPARRRRPFRAGETFLDKFGWFCLVTAALVFFVQVVAGCASIAQQLEGGFVILEPDDVTLEEDRCLVKYQILGKPQVLELSRFELELEGGERIECIGMYGEANHIDGSQNRWISVPEMSDSRCESEMQKLAREDPP